MWGNPTFIPKRKSSDAAIANTRKCLFSDCQERDRLVFPKFDSAHNLEAEIGVQSTPEKPLLVCPKHYSALYRQLHGSEPCACCGIKPKQRKCFTRHSPNAAIINDILSETNLDGNRIRDSDYVCNTCYKMHLSMPNETYDYDDNKLIQLVESWKMTLADEVTDVATRVTLHTVLYVADEIMHERAVLLSQVFIAVYTENSEQSQTEYVLEIGEGTVNYTTRWLLILNHSLPINVYTRNLELLFFGKMETF